MKPRNFEEFINEEFSVHVRVYDDFIADVEEIKDTYHYAIDNAELFNILDNAILKAKEMKELSLKN